MELVFYESRVWRLIKVSDVVGQRIFWFLCTIPVGLELCGEEN
jgi:hypothetical protein